ncbi:MAG: DUF58 domain-containing protein, partial [Planctomycetota bacterium]
HVRLRAGVLGGGAWYTLANLLFGAVGLMSGGRVASAGWVVLTLRKVSVERVVPEQAVAGEATVLRYRLRNRSRLPVFALSIEEVWGKGTEDPVGMRPRRLKGAPLGWVLHLAPRSGGVAESTCWPLRRGRLRFERVRLSSSFPFGVLGRWVEFEDVNGAGGGGSGSVLVYPTIYPLSKRLAFRAWSMTGGLEDSVQQGGREGEVIGMRGYRPGDPERSIDWKRTARTGRLISREYGRPMPPMAVIELDLTPPGALGLGGSGGLRGLLDGGGKSGRGKGGARDEAWFEWLTRAESAIALTASLVHDAYVRGYRVGLTVRGAAGRSAGGLSFEAKHAASHLAMLLDALAEVEVHGQAASADALEGVGGRPGRGTLRVVAAASGRGAVRGAVSVASDSGSRGFPAGGGGLSGRSRGRVPVLVPEDLERIAGAGSARLAVGVGAGSEGGGG